MAKVFQLYMGKDDADKAINKTIARFEINKFGFESVSIHRANLLELLKDESKEWINLGVAEFPDKFEKRSKDAPQSAHSEAKADGYQPQPSNLTPKDKSPF